MRDEQLLDFFNLNEQKAPSIVIDDFETLLNTSSNIHEEHEIKVRNETTKKVDSAFDFIKCVQDLCNKTMTTVLFKPDDEMPKILTPKHQIDDPVISFKVIRRKPVKELKPIMRNEFVETIEERNEERYGTVYYQRFECKIQFNIFASGYNLAEEVMNKFEEVMLKYSYVFLENGIQQCVFEEQKEDEHYDLYRQSASVRSLVYKIVYEKNLISFQQTIQAVEANLKNRKGL